MGTMQKTLLALAVAGLLIGIPVTAIRATPPPALTLALPLGMTFLGLFLLSRLWQKEIARFDAEERLRHERAERYAPPANQPEDHPAGSRRASWKARHA